MYEQGEIMNQQVDVSTVSQPHWPGLLTFLKEHHLEEDYLRADIQTQAAYHSMHHQMQMQRDLLVGWDGSSLPYDASRHCLSRPADASGVDGNQIMFNSTVLCDDRAAAITTASSSEELGSFLVPCFLDNNFATDSLIQDDGGMFLLGGGTQEDQTRQHGSYGFGKDDQLSLGLPYLDQNLNFLQSNSILKKEIKGAGEDTLFRRQAQINGSSIEAHGLQLLHMLLKCADAISRNMIDLATTLLWELQQRVSLYGDSMQRIAAHFAEGLAARLMGKDSSLYKSLMLQPRIEDFLSAFTALYKVSPYFRFAHFTANQAILEAIEGCDVVHVIDLDIMQGFQWPSFLQALASRAGGAPHLRLTGIGRERAMLVETGKRLASFAESLGVSFEFNPVVEELQDLSLGSLGFREGEAIAVNCVFQLHGLLNQPNEKKLERFVSFLYGIGPLVVTVVEQEANHNAPSFLTRFVEALHYYAAVFDSLDAALPQQNEDRVKIEQMYFAQHIKNIVACEGCERLERHEPSSFWRRVMEEAGFHQVPLSSHTISEAKLLLQLCPCEGYRLNELQGSLSLGWQERYLLTASAWS